MSAINTITGWTVKSMTKPGIDCFPTPHKYIKKNMGVTYASGICVKKHDEEVNNIRITINNLL